MTAQDVARALPDIPTLRHRCQVLAVLEAILYPDPGQRTHGFQVGWTPEADLAWMDNGSGDEYSVVFTEAGAVVRGFDHESAMSPYASDDLDPWPGLVDDLPSDFHDFLALPPFDQDDNLAVTALIWRRWNGTRWQTGEITYPAGNDPDGSQWLFQLLVAQSSSVYQEYVAGFDDRPVDRQALRALWHGAVLTESLAHKLNPAACWPEVRAEAEAVGFAVA
ncbi:hypothetical protein JOF53_001557 [Crossiella equi]|uniref:Uncharacterized protein n=1 Tax=Crossiella equi TaxID=130796 RepID=A0ABS5A7Y3_9PSEU|nr:hypothetical protein [Crossiella equi]MBP2472685.1 hypothetical protein [Crossiella equi]